MFYISCPTTYVHVQLKKNIYLVQQFFVDQRGISQEVSLVTKHGVEAKSYEGVRKY